MPLVYLLKNLLKNLSSSCAFLSNLWWFGRFQCIADLKTMLKRVESEQYYVTFEMFVADAKRMFANARTYNSPETIYYKCSTRHSALIHMLIFPIAFSNLIILISYYERDIVQIGKPLSKQSSIRSPIWSKKSAVTNTIL